MCAGAPRETRATHSLARVGSVETATKRARGLVHLLRAFQLLSVHRDAHSKDFCCIFPGLPIVISGIEIISRILFA